MELMEMLELLGSTFRTLKKETSTIEVIERAKNAGRRSLDESGAGGLWDLSNELFKDQAKQEIAYNVLYFVYEFMENERKTAAMFDLLLTDYCEVFGVIEALELLQENDYDAEEVKALGFDDDAIDEVYGKMYVAIWRNVAGKKGSLLGKGETIEEAIAEALENETIKVYDFDDSDIEKVEDYIRGAKSDYIVSKERIKCD